MVLIQYNHSMLNFSLVIIKIVNIVYTFMSINNNQNSSLIIKFYIYHFCEEPNRIYDCVIRQTVPVEQVILL